MREGEAPPTRPADFHHSAASVEAGVARRDITPPVGIYARQWGAASHDASEGIHRPLAATVMVMRSAASTPPLVLASIDAGWWQSIEDEARVRGALRDAFNLDPAHLLIALSHTHAACSICTDDADKPGGEHIAPYLETITHGLIDAAQEAMRRLEPATVEWSIGRCDLATHRDLPDPDGRRHLCGFNPTVPADDALVVGRVANEQGRRLATIVNYACHPTTLAWGNRLVSPDYIGAMREVIEGHTDDTPCLFLQGASGDLGPREGYVGDTAIADANGRRLGHAVLATLEGMLPPRTALQYAGVVESGAPIATWTRRRTRSSQALRAEVIEIDLPLKRLPAADQIETELEGCSDRVLAERLRRKLRLLRKVGSGPTCRIATWFWQIGDAVLVAQPNECYSVLQTTLRQRFPDCVIPVVTVVNGGLGYLTPPECHDLDLYQVWQSPFGREALPTLIRACERQIEGMIGRP